MGLVMQEPTLFNYTITENILYGNPMASNEQVREAAQVANAVEFIESDELMHAFEDNAEALYEACKTREKELKETWGEQETK